MPAQTYAPKLELLKSRPLPVWYDKAKFGIFIHWGMWAIPASGMA
jgi:alpha-L-fucosidase